MYDLLDKVNSPADIKGFSKDELKRLCAEIRDYMVQCCSRNPGHLASSLGAVEIITALHYVYDTPEDKIVFDVGHQAYAHKILTGRREAFTDIRTKGGLSGFPKRQESPYDCFGVGHSSTSISAAFGIAEAVRMQGRNEKVVAVIGDGALTGGLAFEGINNAGASKSDLLIILNDNNQSIDGNIGGLHNHLLKMTTNPAFNRMKEKVWNSMGETSARSFFQRWSRSFKSWLVKRSGGDLFESLGFRYFGPVDGNNIVQLTETLEKLREMNGPRVLHCITKKGKGYAPAEADPTTWHAPGRFNPETGERIKQNYEVDRYQDVFGEVLLELARRDSRVVGITPAMASGCGMNLLAKEMPERFFDVGIEEEHAVTFAAGLAVGGMRPFCNLYSAFSQRAYDQIIHDVALQKLPVVLCFDRAGLVGEDGATHQGAFDLAAYRSIPGIRIIVPRNEVELKNAMYAALEQEDGPIIIRYPRGRGEGTGWRSSEAIIEKSYSAERLVEGQDIAVLGIGPAVNRAVEASDRMKELGCGSVAVYDMRQLKPIDTETLDTIAKEFRKVVTVEDGTLKGGLFSAVCEYLGEKGFDGRIKGVGIPDKFIAHASQKEQQADCGLDTDSLTKLLQNLSQKE